MNKRRLGNVNFTSTPNSCSHEIVDSKSAASEQGRRSLRIAMLTYSFYESDGRVRRYAETLARRGESVDVISLRRQGQGTYNELNGVRVHRIQERVRDEKGKFAYLYRILKFFFGSAAVLTWEHLKRPYDLVHVHSVPDFEVFAAFVPRLFGARIILDIHDIVPELYCNKFKMAKDSLVFRLLVAVEQLSTAFSHHTIISNDLWRNTLVSRSVSAKKCTSILNYPDDQLFRNSGSHKSNGKTVLLYPGTLNHHQGLDIAVNAFGKIRDLVPDAELQIYGDGPARPELENLVRDLGLYDRVFLKDPVSLDAIVGIMANADIGVIPKKNDDFGGEAFSTKTLEFMMLGVPIILSRTRIDDYYFDDSMVTFFESGNVEDLAEAMLTLIKNQQLRHDLSQRAADYARSQCWTIKKKVYLDLVNSLCAK